MIINIILIDLFFLLNSNKPTVIWEKHINERGLYRCNDIIETNDGCFALTGDYKATPVDDWNIMLLKIDNHGKSIWFKEYRHNQECHGRAVRQTHDGGYIIAGYAKHGGISAPSIYIIKTDSSGDTTWNKTFDGEKNGCIAYDILPTVNNSYIIMGTTCDENDEDIYLLKIDSFGNILWKKTYGGAERDWCWSIKSCREGGCVVAGTSSSFGNKKDDIWILRLDSLGGCIWKKLYGGPDWEHGMDVVQTADSGFIIVGQTNSFRNGGPDGWIIKTNFFGDTIWTKNYGGHGSDEFRAIKHSGGNEYLVVGNSDSFGFRETDVFIVKIDASGKEIWKRTYGGQKKDYGESIEVTHDNYYIIAGYSTSFIKNQSSSVYLLKISDK